MVENHDTSRRKLLAGLAAGTVGSIALVAQSNSASAALQADPTYNVQDQTAEVTGQIEAVRLAVDATVNYTAEKEITTLGATLSVGPQGASELETLDTSIIQQNSKEQTIEQSLTANLGEVVALSDLQESTTEFQSELYVFIESNGERIAETTMPESFTVELTDGSVESSLGVTAEGNIEISESG